MWLQGMKIVVSDKLKDVPKIEFALFKDSAKVQEFNDWLYMMFGAKECAFVNVGDTIFCTNRGYSKLKKNIEFGSLGGCNGVY